MSRGRSRGRCVPSLRRWSLVLPLCWGFEIGFVLVLVVVVVSVSGDSGFDEATIVASLLFIGNLSDL